MVSLAAYFLHVANLRQVELPDEVVAMVLDSVTAKGHAGVVAKLTLKSYATAT